MKRNYLDFRLLDSRIHSENTTRSEQLLGYFLGPCLVFMTYTGVAGTYLTQFYTDVLGLAGSLLTWMPLFSKLLSGAIGLLIGRLIDRTKTAQGKARPWILASGVLLTVCGIALYAVPRATYQVKIVWVVVSYNLFFSLAFSVYSLSHSLMVPLSTRSTRQRDSLAMMTSMGTSMIPGMLSTVIMPLLIQKIGVGEDAQGAWLTVMSVLSVIAIPATLIQYYFTKERVTEEVGSSIVQKTTFFQQLRACLSDRYWVMITAFTVIVNLCSGLSSGSMLYYCNWVLGNSVESGAAKQILVNVIGQAPLGFGVAILWPLVRKFGKRKVTMIGFSVASLGSMIVLLGRDNTTAVLGGLLIKSTGSLPTYVMSAYLAESLDHIEWRRGFRVDGFSASVSGIILSLVMGLSQTMLLAGIQAFGYISPEATDQVILQTESIRSFFSWCFAGIPMVGYAICAGIILFYTVESQMPQITKDLSVRHQQNNEGA